MIVITRFYFPEASTITSILKRVLDNISYKVIVYSKVNRAAVKFPLYLIEKENQLLIPLRLKIKKSLINNFFNNLIFIAGSFIFFIIVLISILFKKDKEIMTCSNPKNIHWFGVIFKIFKPSGKWIAFFSDPYSNSPFIGNKNGIFDEIEEKLVFKLADKVIYMSEAQRDYCYKGTRKEEQTVVFPFYYKSTWKKAIQENVKNKNHLKGDKIKLVHPGNIYGNRNPKEFLEAIVKYKDIIEFHNIGMFDNSILDSLEGSSNIFIHPSVDYEVLLEYLLECDYMVVIDSFFENIKNPYMPSKVVDAMYFDKPIIGITELETELDKFLIRTKNISVENKVENIKIALEKIAEGKVNIKPDYHEYCDMKIEII